MAELAPERLFGYRLRRQQREILAYGGGRMAVSAVPGSGKTLTLSLLAARLIVEGHIGDQGEVLVVTVQNSAVANIGQRIRHILHEQNVPAVGFRVCTLHKLAADILRLRLDIAGVEDDVHIVDAAETARLIARAADTWRAEHRAWWESFLPEPDDPGRARQEDSWRRETERVAREVIKLCKHLRLTPERALELAGHRADGDEFLRMGIELYALYAGYLQIRGGLDFDDLIWRALDALDGDATYLAGLRRRWPYILEDEAQDSSPLQEHILERLSGPGGNWVRVGDPNQSINSTFTAADPRYFRRFLDREGVLRRDLPQTGRCAPPIMELANRLVAWVREEHPEDAIRHDALQAQRMVPTEAGDPQPNPPADGCLIHFAREPARTLPEEARRALDVVRRYLATNPQGTCAVLCPKRETGAAVVAALQRVTPPVPFDDLLDSTPRMRWVASTLAVVLGALAGRTRRAEMVRLFGALAEEGHLGSGGAADGAGLRRALAIVRSVAPAQLLFPLGASRVPEAIPTDGADLEAMERFARLAARWARGASLPPDQLLLTIAQDLYADETDLAVCHALASYLRGMADSHPDWRLPQYRDELDAIGRNRRTLGLSLADAGYVDQPGRVIVTTMHKAKGLEWDLVFLMSVDDLEFPTTCDDAFRDGPFFMGGRAPAIEARKRLEQLAGAGFACPADLPLVKAARLEYIAERLRLLYVGITRARRYLVISYGKKNRSREVGPARALVVLRAYQREAQGVAS